MGRRLPRDAGSVVVACCAAWAGCLLGLSGLWIAAPPGGIGALIALRTRPRVAAAAAVLVAGVLSGSAAGARVEATLGAPLPRPGPIEVSARMVVDPLPSPFGERLVVSTIAEDAQTWPPSGLRLVVSAVAVPARLAAGEVIRISGDLRDRPGWLRGDPYRATVIGATVTRVAGPSGPLFSAGNGLRRLVLDRLEPQRDRPESALLAGFLVGDTTDLPEIDLEHLRRSGLTHFVAVSGSNVALFLGAWWLVAGPIGLGPRVRAAGGLVALVVFVVATRWEPSVVRAATMAGLVLTGRIVGLPIGPWRALGGAVVALLLISGELATDVGFQLSVAATAGVLAGAHVAGPRHAGGRERSSLPLWGLRSPFFRSC